MKYIIISLTFFSIAACNSNHHPIRTERMDDNNTTMKIEDDSKTMSIKVKTKDTDNPLDYNESFDVRDINDKQKEKLKNHILDSLHVKIK